MAKQWRFNNEYYAVSYDNPIEAWDDLFRKLDHAVSAYNKGNKSDPVSWIEAFLGIELEEFEV